MTHGVPRERARGRAWVVNGNGTVGWPDGGGPHSGANVVYSGDVCGPGEPDMRMYARARMRDACALMGWESYITNVENICGNQKNMPDGDDTCAAQPPKTLLHAPLCERVLPFRRPSSAHQMAYHAQSSQRPYRSDHRPLLRQ